MKHVSVGILGFGTVGAGVADCLLKNRGLICERTGVDVELTGIGDLDTTTDRGVAVPTGILSAGFVEVLEKKNQHGDKDEKSEEPPTYCPHCGKKLR